MSYIYPECPALDPLNWQLAGKILVRQEPDEEEEEEEEEENDRKESDDEEDDDEDGYSE